MKTTIVKAKAKIETTFKIYNLMSVKDANIIKAGLDLDTIYNIYYLANLRNMVSDYFEDLLREAHVTRSAANYPWRRYLMLTKNFWLEIIVGRMLELKKINE